MRVGTLSFFVAISVPLYVSSWRIPRILNSLTWKKNGSKGSEIFIKSVLSTIVATQIGFTNELMLPAIADSIPIVGQRSVIFFSTSIVVCR